MSDAPATRIDLSGPQLRADLRGYVLGDRFIDGFEDRLDLEPAHRWQVASWAEAYGHDLSETQRELVRQAAPVDETALEVLAATVHNRDFDLPLAYQFGLHQRLDAEQALVVEEPWRGIAGEERRDYPLNVAELAELTGSTPKQVREWEKATVLPAYRIDGRRQFFSAAVIHAFALRELDRFQIAALARLRGATDDDPFLRLTEHALEVRRAAQPGDRPSVSEIYKAALRRIRQILVSPPGQLAPGRIEAPEPSAEVPDEAESGSLARTTLARSLKLHDAVEDVLAHSGPAQPLDSSVAFRDNMILWNRDPAVWNVVVYPAGEEGWLLSTDLGVHVRHKNEAVQLGKQLSARLSDGHVRVYNKHDGRVVSTRGASRRK